MKKVFCLLIIIAIWSCADTQKQHTTNPQEKENTSIQPIDTSQNDYKLDTASRMIAARFHPVYMGVDDDSIYRAYWLQNIDKEKYALTAESTYKEPVAANLELYVDTTWIIGSVDWFMNPPLPPPYNTDIEVSDNRLEDFNNQIKSYATVVKNVSNDTLIIGYGTHIPLSVEAKDSLGNWKTVQKNYVYSCGVGVSAFWLPPKEIVITPCKLFDGDFETTLRVAFGFDKILYSNEFKGTINYK